MPSIKRGSASTARALPENCYSTSGVIEGGYCASRNFETFGDFPVSTLSEHKELNHWIEACQIKPVSSIEWIWKDRWKFGPRSLQDSMWFWIEDGEATGHIRQERFHIGPDSLLLIPRGVEHEIVHEKETSRLHAVHFNATVYGGIDVLELLGYPYTLSTEEHHNFFQQIADRLSREFALKAPGWTTAMSADITAVLLHIIRFHGTEFHFRSEGKMKTDLPRLLPALEWISEHLLEPELRVSDMAACINVCESQFRKLFDRVMGISPVQFLQRQRVERACSMLLTTDLSVEQIALACGFSDTPFFYRVFKTWAGTSPRLYRTHVRNIGIPLEALTS